MCLHRGLASQGCLGLSLTSRHARPTCPHVPSRSSTPWLGVGGVVRNADSCWESSKSATLPMPHFPYLSHEGNTASLRVVRNDGVFNVKRIEVPGSEQELRCWVGQLWL